MWCIRVNSSVVCFFYFFFLVPLMSRGISFTYSPHSRFQGMVGEEGVYLALGEGGVWKV